MPPDTGESRPLEADGWHTLRRFLPYLWPKDRPDLRARIVGAMLLVLCAKAVILLTPLALKRVVDTIDRKSVV